MNTKTIVASVAIEIACRFVTQQQSWLRQQRSADRHALPFPLREATRKATQFIANAYILRQLSCSFAHTLADRQCWADAIVQQDVVQNRQMVE
jgi:hypothetical protein